MPNILQSSESFILHKLVSTLLHLDELDFQILKALKENSKLSLNKLEEMIQKKSSTLHARIKKLETNKVIKSYTINIDNKQIGQSLVGFIMLNFEQNQTDLDQETIGKQIANLARVEEVHLIAGEYDILLKARAKNIEDLGEFVTKELKEIDGVGNSRTFVCLNIIKESADPPFLIERLV